MQKWMLFAVLCLGLTSCTSWTHRRGPNQETSVVLKDAQGNAREAGPGATFRDGKPLSQIPVEDPQVNTKQTAINDAHPAPTETETDATAVAASPASAPSAETQTQVKELKEAVAAAASLVQNTHGADKRTVGAVPAAKALGWLKNGNTRFVKGFFRKDGAAAKDRKRVSGQQSPHTAIFTTSDSRIPPEVIFDQKLGEIFVVRTLNLRLRENVMTSLEYAVNELGVNNVVILGPDATQVAAVAAELSERSAIMRDGMASGEVKINQALYNLDSGRVEWP